MGYLSFSCRVESAVSTSNSLTPSPSFSSSSTTTTAKKQNDKGKEKPIKIQHFHYSDLEAATNGFSERKLLAKGSHGYFYEAVVRGRPVAVKRPSRPHYHNLPPKSSPMVSSSSSASAPEFIISNNEVDNEIDILSKIQSLRLVNLVGFTNDSPDMLLVVELMSNGTFYNDLHSSSNNNNNSKLSNWERRVCLITNCKGN